MPGGVPARREKRPQVHRIDDRLRPEMQTAIVQDYADGIPLREVRERYGVSRHVVHTLARRGGVPLHQRRATPDEARRAAELYATGLSLTEVGRRIGVTARTVQRLLEQQGIPRRDTHGRSK